MCRWLAPFLVFFSVDCNWVSGVFGANGLSNRNVVGHTEHTVAITGLYLLVHIFAYYL